MTNTKRYKTVSDRNILVKLLDKVLSKYKVRNNMEEEKRAFLDFDIVEPRPPFLYSIPSHPAISPISPDTPKDTHGVPQLAGGHRRGHNKLTGGFWVAYS